MDLLFSLVTFHGILFSFLAVFFSHLVTRILLLCWQRKTRRKRKEIVSCPKKTNFTLFFSSRPAGRGQTVLHFTLNLHRKPLFRSSKWANIE